MNGVYTFTNQGSFTTDTGTKPTNKATTLLKEEQLTLHKVDDAGKALSGVKFALADTEANAKGGKYLKKDADGNVVYPSDSNYSASLADYTGTTDTNGNVTWKAYPRQRILLMNIITLNCRLLVIINYLQVLVWLRLLQLVNPQL